MYTKSMPGEKFTEISKQKTAENQEERLEKLFECLPDDLEELWRNKIENLSIETQIAKITELLEKRSIRSTVRHESRLLPAGVQIFNSFPEDLRDSIETLRKGKRGIEIGYGQAGHVIANTEMHPDTCYKLLFDEETLPPATNDIAVETELQYQIGTLLDQKHGVLVPRIFGFISEPGTRAITMELLNAPSLRKVIERKAEDMPKNFNSEKFFEALDKFVADMHLLGYYHRDLHSGNVLVHRETGMPCVIDFGLSKYVPIEDLDTYKERVVESGQMVEVMLKSDESNVEQLKSQVKKYLAQQQGI